MTLQEEALTKATKAYARHEKDWAFLGYSDAVALAVLTEFFSMGKVRNASPKPLNVLAMVGKRKIVEIKAAVTATHDAAVERDSSDDRGE